MDSLLLMVVLVWKVLRTGLTLSIDPSMFLYMNSWRWLIVCWITVALALFLLAMKTPSVLPWTGVIMRLISAALELFLLGMKTPSMLHWKRIIICWMCWCEIAFDNTLSFTLLGVGTPFTGCWRSRVVVFCEGLEAHPLGVGSMLDTAVERNSWGNVGRNAALMAVVDNCVLTNSFLRNTMRLFPVGSTVRVYP